MNILLVRPRPHKDTINLQSFMICEPLELEYIAAVAEAQGHRADIVDLILERRSLEHFLSRERYDLVVFTGYISHVTIIKDLARRAKRYDPSLITLVGGVHAEVLPEDFADPALDFIVCDNGLSTLQTLLSLPATEALRGAEPAGRSAALAAVTAQVPGVWLEGRERAALETRFHFPFPARAKTAKYRHRYSYGFHNRCACLKTSFGCPYKCTFCFCAAITRNTYFERDLAEVVEELKQIDETNIFIVDDNFLLRRERVLEFCRLMRENGLHKQYILFGRADFIADNPDAMRELRDIGVQAVFVGVESCKEDELAAMDKKTSPAINAQALATLQSLGIIAYCGLVTGASWQRSHFDDLIVFLRQFKRPIFNLQPLTPVPGTPFYEQTKGDIVVPRERHELWDLAHVLFEPKNMSLGDYYANILRVYYSTAGSLGMHWYTLRRFGLRAYLRTLRGMFVITRQYQCLIREARQQARRVEAAAGRAGPLNGYTEGTAGHAAQPKERG